MAKTELADDCHQRDIVDVVDVGAGLHLGAGKNRFLAEEPGEDILLGQAVVMLLNTSLVHRLGRANGDLVAVDGQGFLELHRVYGLCCLAQGSLRADETALLGGFEEFFAEHRVGDADHGDDPLLYAFAEEIDGAVFGYHVMDIAPWNHNHVVVHIGDDIGFDAAFGLAGRKEHEDGAAAG